MKGGEIRIFGFSELVVNYPIGCITQGEGGMCLECGDTLGG